MPNLLPPFKINYDYFDHELTSRTYNIYAPKNISGRRYEHIEISDDGCLFRLRDKSQGDVVSFILVEKVKLFKSSFLKIRATKSIYPRRKLLSYLFDLLLEELDKVILSDNLHTSPGSKEFWIELGRKKKYDVYTLNIDTNYKRKYSSHKENEIWGLNIDLITQFTFLLESYNLNNPTLYEDAYIEPEIIEFEGDEDIELILINEASTTKEIFDFYKKFKDNISCKSHIRLVAQKN